MERFRQISSSCRISLFTALLAQQLARWAMGMGWPSKVGAEAVFKKGVEPAAGHVAEVQGGGAQPAEITAAFEELFC